MLLDESLPELRDIWESTSFALEARQCDRDCVQQERSSLLTRPGPSYRLSFDFAASSSSSHAGSLGLSPSAAADSKDSRPRHRVAVVRQEGSNGDREMLAAFHAAGLEAWDVNMYDSHVTTSPNYVTICIHHHCHIPYPAHTHSLSSCCFPLSSLGTICSTVASRWSALGGWCSVEASAMLT